MSTQNQTYTITTAFTGDPDPTWSYANTAPNCGYYTNTAPYYGNNSQWQYNQITTTTTSNPYGSTLPYGSQLPYGSTGGYYQVIPQAYKIFVIGGVAFRLYGDAHVGSYKFLDKDALLAISKALMDSALSGSCMQTNILSFMQFYCSENLDTIGLDLVTGAMLEMELAASNGPSVVKFGEEEGEITRMVVVAAMSLEASAEELD